jgi:hypothetical protein
MSSVQSDSSGFGDTEVSAESGGQEMASLKVHSLYTFMNVILKVHFIVLFSFASVHGHCLHVVLQSKATAVTLLSAPIAAQ